MSLLEIAEKIVDYVARREIKKKEAAAGYVGQVLDVCYELIAIREPKSDRATFLHEQLKAVYDKASGSFRLAHTEHGYILFRALSSARVYYWTRVFEGHTDEEITHLLHEREQTNMFIRSQGLLNAYLSDSEPEQKLRESWRSNSDSQSRLKAVRELCLADIGKLGALKMELDMK